MKPPKLYALTSKLFFTCLLVTAIPLALPSFADDSLTLGVHPYLSTVELMKRFNPLAERLGGRIGARVEIRISKNYQEHIDLIGGNKLDIAYLGPASYVKLVDAYGKRPIIARLEVGGRPDFQGVIIAAKDSLLHSITDLKGKRFAFGDPDSTMSHLVPRYMLWEAGIGVNELSDYSFLKNHNNVALGVLMGDYDAGAVKEEVFYKYEKRGLKALAWTPRISEHLFVARGDLEPALVEKARDFFRDLANSDDGAEALRSIKESATGAAAAEDADYDNLRKIMRAFERLGVE